jgi:hypothetical protein
MVWCYIFVFTNTFIVQNVFLLRLNINYSIAFFHFGTLGRKNLATLHPLRDKCYKCNHILISCAFQLTAKLLSRSIPCSNRIEGNALGRLDLRTGWPDEFCKKSRPKCSPTHFFAKTNKHYHHRGKKVAQNLGYFCNFKFRTLLKVNCRPKGEKLPNLVTLPLEIHLHWTEFGLGDYIDVRLGDLYELGVRELW